MTWCVKFDEAFKVRFELLAKQKNVSIYDRRMSAQNVFSTVLGFPLKENIDGSVRKTSGHGRTCGVRSAGRPKVDKWGAYAWANEMGVDADRNNGVEAGHVHGWAWERINDIRTFKFRSNTPGKIIEPKEIELNADENALVDRFINEFGYNETDEWMTFEMKPTWFVNLDRFKKERENNFSKQ